METSTLKDNLLKKISERGIERGALAAKVGITQESLSLILTDNTKNPSVYTVAKMAKALNCSIAELIEQGTPETKVKDQTTFKPELAKDCALTILDLLEQKKQKASFAEWKNMIKTIYGYSLDKTNDSIDEHFANWFVDYSCKNSKPLPTSETDKSV